MGKPTDEAATLRARVRLLEVKILRRDAEIEMLRATVAAARRDACSARRELRLRTNADAIPDRKPAGSRFGTELFDGTKKT